MLLASGCLQVGARARGALERVKEAAEQQEAEVGHAAELAEVSAALRQEATAAAPSANLFTSVRAWGVCVIPRGCI